MNIAELTAEQLTAIQAQLKAQASERLKEQAKTKDARYAIVDSMLATKLEAGGFMYTTSDILLKLQEQKLVGELSKEDRAEYLKKIQTRKQNLEKLRDKTGTLVHAPGKFGYKPSAGGFTINADRVIDWLMEDENVATLSAADRKAILKALKA